MAQLTPIPKMQFLDDYGDPLSGGKVYTYELGTTTPKLTYQDREETTPNTNPVILDAAGRAYLWATNAGYTFVIHDSDDVLQGGGGNVFITDEEGLQAQIDAWELAFDALELRVTVNEGDILVLQGQVTTLEGQVATLIIDVDAAEVDIAAIYAALLLKADIDSETLTGIPLAPTAAAGTSTTQIATTAFVTEAVAGAILPVPSGVMVTGDILGFGYSYLSVSTITVDAGACLDSLNTTVISSSSSQVVTIGSVAGEIYNLFACDDGVVRTDVTSTGSNLSAYKIRFIGYVKNDSSGQIIKFVYGKDWMTFLASSHMVVNSYASPPSGLVSSLSINPFIPSVDRTAHATFGVIGNHATSYTSICIGNEANYSLGTIGNNGSYLGNGDLQAWGGISTSSNLTIPITSNYIFWGDGTYNNLTFQAAVLIQAVHLRR